MTTPILVCNPIANFSNTASRYFSLVPMGNTGAAGSDTLQMPMPTAGTISKLYVTFPIAVTGTQQYTVTLTKNGVDTALTATITSASTTAQDPTHSFSVVAGDLISCHIDPLNTPVTQDNAMISVVFDGTTDGESIVLAYLGGLNTAGAAYGSPGVGISPETVESNATMVFPTDGVIDTIYVSLNNAPGGVATRTFTLRKGGVDTLLTTTVGSGSTANNGTSSISITAGNTISIGSTVSGTPAAANAFVSMRFKPTTNGESVMLARTTQPFSTGATRYVNTGGTTGNFFDTDNGSQAVAPVAFTWKKEYVNFDTAPGLGTSRTHTSRLGGADAALTVNMADANTTNQDTTHSVSVVAGDRIDWSSVPANVPAASTIIRVSAVMFIATTPTVTAVSVGTLAFMGVG